MAEVIDWSAEFEALAADHAEAERATVEMRTMDGLAAARVAVPKGGRRNALSPKWIDAIRNLYETGEMTVSEIAAAFKSLPPDGVIATWGGIGN